MKSRSTSSSFLRKMVDCVIKKASGYKVSYDYFPSSLKSVVIEVVEEVSKEIIAERNGIIFCAICGRGPFQKKGIYLHLKRVHRDSIEKMVAERLEEKIWYTTRRIRVE